MPEVLVFGDPALLVEVQAELEGISSSIELYDPVVSYTDVPIVVLSDDITYSFPEGPYAASDSESDLPVNDSSIFFVFVRESEASNFIMRKCLDFFGQNYHGFFSLTHPIESFGGLLRQATRAAQILQS